MSQDTPYTESQKLVRCSVLNRDGERSARLVELEHFRLWEYLMTHKHGLSVTEPCLCLWLHEDEFAETALLYQTVDGTEAVDRIVIDIFDAEYGFANTITRYVPTAETPDVLAILHKHIPELRDDPANANVEIVHGWAVQPWQQVDTPPELAT